MKKQKILVIGITMNCGGSEKSFLSFVHCLDFERFDVTLLLAKKTGLFMQLLPPQIHVIEMQQYGEMFTLDGGSAMHVIWNEMVKKHPLYLFEILPYALKMKMHPEKHADLAMQLWCRLMQHFPAVKESYDIALAYWGDKTMFYMCDKVNAKKKIAWLHFDYNNPPREDALYLPYFQKCDYVVTVSQPIHDSLCRKLPQMADHIAMMENINSAALIQEMANTGDTYPDNFSGKRILTIGRICEQKGYDIAVEALGILRDHGHNVKWYIIGGGSDTEKEALIAQATARGCADALVFLGTTTNPYKYLADCDIYAQPSRFEGKPIAVEEAKILAKPIVITDFFSAKEQLSNGKFGLICNMTPESIATNIEKLLNHPEICATFTQALQKSCKGNEEEIQVFYKMIDHE